MKKISVAISYCNLDANFILPLVEQVTRVANEIIFVTFDRLLSGEFDDCAPIARYLTAHVQSLSHGQTSFNHINLPINSLKDARFHHNLARWSALKSARSEHILFLDSDEIPLGIELEKWLRNDSWREFNHTSFSCYWYFRSSRFRAMTREHCGLLSRAQCLTEEVMFTEKERWGVFQGLGGERPVVMGPTGPIFHHFSWARSRLEMTAKVRAWGHRHDRDWCSLINREFSSEFSGTDFVHGYMYETVADIFGLENRS